MRYVIIIISVLMLTSCGLEKKAQKAFRYGEYQNAIDDYISLANKSGKVDDPKLNYYIGESYRLSNRIKSAETYYQKGRNFPEKKDSATLYYAQALKANGKYEESEQAFRDLYENVSTTASSMKLRAERELAALKHLKELDQKAGFYKVKNLTALNTPMSEYAPTYMNGNLYFTANREAGDKKHTATGLPFTRLYKIATKGAKVDVNTIESLAGKINSPNANEGCITFSPNGRVMVFARGNNGKQTGGEDVDLYMSIYRRGKWSEPRKININLPMSWESTPAFSNNGRTLYFSSSRKGGYGGLDLYSANMSGRGRFSRPKNLGSSINTSGNELFPYVSKSGTLYFSSDGHPGYGMLDLFSAKRKGGVIKLENLGRPINSEGDDFGLFLFKPNKGFFSSNREGGNGDDDIYTFVNNNPDLKVVNYYLEGVVKTEVDDKNEQELLSGVAVRLLDAQGIIMQDYVTGDDGKFLFQVYESEDYVLMGERDGYLVKRQSYSTKGKSVPLSSLTELTTDITLDTTMVMNRLQKNKVFVLKNIYFDFDEYNIREDAAYELDRLAELLNDNPEIIIEMGSHTDSVSTNEYNATLSQQRAESTVAYLISKGIAPDRLTAKGYGEEQPIAPNTNPDGTDNPSGRQRNRRTEFKIIEIGEVKKMQFEDFEEDRYFKAGDN